MIEIARREIDEMVNAVTRRHNSGKKWCRFMFKQPTNQLINLFYYKTDTPDPFKAGWFFTVAIPDTVAIINNGFTRSHMFALIEHQVECGLKEIKRKKKILRKKVAA